VRYRGCCLGEEDWRWMEVGSVWGVGNKMSGTVKDRGPSRELRKCKSGRGLWRLYRLLRIFKQLKLMGGWLKQGRYCILNRPP
jgi:hypothetical protein